MLGWIRFIHSNCEYAHKKSRQLLKDVILSFYYNFDFQIYLVLRQISKYQANSIQTIRPVNT